ncbi:hypothetical protein PBY51_005699 [Eleginops maclovinus]|nr:hypothetical protein PBY51_005699 [Eleginops maclovinus]
MKASSETSSSPPAPPAAAPPAPLSLRSPALQAEFLQKCRNKSGSQDGHGDAPSSSSSSKSPLSNVQRQDIMKASSPPSETSSSPPPAAPRPPLCLRSPALQAEFLQKRQNKLRSQSDVGESSVVSPSSSPQPSPSSSSSSLSHIKRQARLSLSSTELLTELRETKTRSLRRVHHQTGLTTVFCGRGGRGGGGRGGQVSGSARSKQSANQKASR